MLVDVQLDGAMPLRITGAPGAGKTTALAARAAAAAGRGDVLVVCPNASSCAAFRASLERAGAAAPGVRVDTLEGHVAGWMRRDFVSSGASPELLVGGDLDSLELARSAGRSILDMSWPGFATAGYTLDLPFLGRPDTFFEEAAALFRQLRRWGVMPEDFETGCAQGAATFYGDDVELARVLCADPTVQARASRRGRDALRAREGDLRIQRRAERDLGTLLSYLYREYRAAARGARVLCVEDVLDEGLAWLHRDPAARARVVRGIAAIIVDDAEDSEPALQAIVELLQADGVRDVAVADWAAGAIDGRNGRRPIDFGDRGARTQLEPGVSSARRLPAMRLADECAEADEIARRVHELLRAGVLARDVLLLARDADAAAIYARLLSERGMPVTAPPSAWQSPREIEDLLALACIVDDPYDHAHLLRVLSSPIVALSDLSVLQLCRDPADAAQMTLDVGLDETAARRTALGFARGVASTTLADNVLYGAADERLARTARDSLARFRACWQRWRTACGALSPAAALAYLALEAGFQAAWHAAPEHLRGRLADDGRRLVGAAARSGAGGLRETALRIARGFGSVEPAADCDAAIACRAIGESKGIRRAYVFVAGIAHGRFPRVYTSRAMAYSKRYGLIVRENVAGNAAQTAKFAWYYGKFAAKARYLEEERRALEYALSRAGVQAQATGFGSPPHWAADHDLLAAHET